MLGCHLVAIQLDRLASVEAHQQPPAAIQERGVGNAEQRDAGLLLVHAQHHAGGEVRQQRARGSGGRIGGAGNHAEPSRWRAAHQPLEVRGAVAECRELRHDDDQLRGRLGRQPVQLAFEPLRRQLRHSSRHSRRSTPPRAAARRSALATRAGARSATAARPRAIGAPSTWRARSSGSSRRPGPADLRPARVRAPARPRSRPACRTAHPVAAGTGRRLEATRRLATDASCVPASHAGRRPGRPKSRPRTRLPGDRRGSAPDRPAAAVRRVRRPGSAWSTSGHRRQRSGARCRGRTPRQAAAAGRRARSQGRRRRHADDVQTRGRAAPRRSRPRPRPRSRARAKAAASVEAAERPAWPRRRQPPGRRRPAPARVSTTVQASVMAARASRLAHGSAVSAWSSAKGGSGWKSRTSGGTTCTGRQRPTAPGWHGCRRRRRCRRCGAAVAPRRPTGQARMPRRSALSRGWLRCNRLGRRQAQPQPWPDQVRIGQRARSVQARLAAVQLEQLAPAVFISQYARRDAQQRVARLDRVPALAVHFLDAPACVGHIEHPAGLDHALGFEQLSVRHAPPDVRAQ